MDAGEHWVCLEGWDCGLRCLGSFVGQRSCGLEPGSMQFTAADRYRYRLKPTDSANTFGRSKQRHTEMGARPVLGAKAGTSRGALGESTGPR